MTGTETKRHVTRKQYEQLSDRIATTHQDSVKARNFTIGNSLIKQLGEPKPSAQKVMYEVLDELAGYIEWRYGIRLDTRTLRECWQVAHAYTATAQEAIASWEVFELFRSLDDREDLVAQGGWTQDAARDEIDRRRGGD